VFAVVVQPDGKIVIAGAFTSYNDTARNRIARLNVDGSLDSSFDPGAGADGSVNGIALQNDGKVVIVGGFSNYNGTSRSGIARLNSNGSLDTSFDPGTGTGLFAPRQAVIQTDGKIVIAGSFTSYNGTGRNGVARVNSNGSLDTSFDPGSGSDRTVFGLAIQTDQKILIGGTFFNYNGTARKGIARINTNGSLDTSFDPGGGVLTNSPPNGGGVFAIAIQSDQKIMIGGAFDKYNGTARSAIARLNTNGSLDTSFDPGSGFAFAQGAQINALAIQSDGKIIAAGAFQTYNGTSQLSIARINSNGSLDPTFASSLSVVSSTSALAIQSDGKVLFGSPQDPQRLVRFLSDASPIPTTVQFSNFQYGVAENAGTFTVTVTRSGDLSGISTVDFFTDDRFDTAACSSNGGPASPRCKYVPAKGTLSFAPGESSKTFVILINDNAWVDGNKQLPLWLANANGAGVAFPFESFLTIQDDDSAQPTSNPIDNSDQDLFVRQHYHDFLDREADASGLQFWKNGITNCGSDANCVAVKRVDTSAAFFFSIEFQQTGFNVLRIQRVAFGRRSKDPATRMKLCDWLHDVRQIGSGVVVGQGDWQTQLENNKQAYATQVTTSPAFIALYPTSMTASQYVDALITTAAVTVTAGERAAAISAFGSGGTSGRVAALRSLAEVAQLTQPGTETLASGLPATLATNEGVNREFREAFVLMQFYGYLRRNPTDAPDNNDSGYQFWLYKFNQFGGNYVTAEMVKAFIVSGEYRNRFGP
jgi:uncharacterized delta-60 repeat protein